MCRFEIAKTQVFLSTTQLAPDLDPMFDDALEAALFDEESEILGHRIWVVPSHGTSRLFYNDSF
jgi:hypothetical protein